MVSSFGSPASMGNYSSLQRPSYNPAINRTSEALPPKLALLQPASSPFLDGVLHRQVIPFLKELASRGSVAISPPADHLGLHQRLALAQLPRDLLLQVLLPWLVILTARICLPAGLLLMLHHLPVQAGDGRAGSQVDYTALLFRLPEGMKCGLSIQELILSLERNGGVHLALEVTETSVIADLDAWDGFLQELRQLGLKVVIDDFGTGYASLAYLFRFKADFIKVDRQLSQRLHDADVEAMVDFLIHDQRHHGSGIVMEGIETTHQLHDWQQRGLNRFQGYLFTPAAPELLASPRFR